MTAARLLIVHHSPTPHLQHLHRAVVEGARHPEITGVDVTSVPALDTRPPSEVAATVLAADGYLIGTPANLGYMSGALKHWFDTIYEPSLDHTAGRPFGMWVHGATDTTGAVTSIQRVVAGLRWKLAAEPLSLIGPASNNEQDQAAELGATIAALLSTSAAAS